MPPPGLWFFFMSHVPRKEFVHVPGDSLIVASGRWYNCTIDQCYNFVREFGKGLALRLVCRGPCLDVWAWVHGLTWLDIRSQMVQQRRCHLAYDARADYFQHLSYSNLRMMLKPLSWKQSDSKVASLKVFASIRFRQTQHVKVFWIHNQDVGLFATAKQVAINHQVKQKGLMVQAKDMSPGIWHEGWQCPTPFL